MPGSFSSVGLHTTSCSFVIRYNVGRGVSESLWEIDRFEYVAVGDEKKAKTIPDCNSFVSFIECVYMGGGVIAY